MAAKQKKVGKKSESHISSLVRFLRASILGTFAVGSAAMFLTDFFWFAVIWLAFCALLAIYDIWNENEQFLPIPLKIGCTAFVLLLVLLFCKYVVFFPAPLQIASDWGKNGATVEGVIWPPHTSGLVVSFTNSTDRDYNSFDISMKIGEGVLRVIQSTKLECVPLSQAIMTPMSPGWPTIGEEQRPYRFRCDVLPKHTEVQFVAILENLDWLTKEIQSHPGKTLDAHGNDISAFFGPPRKPTFLVVAASYNVTYRPHALFKRVDIGG
jgi:hypothetical protein